MDLTIFEAKALAHALTERGHSVSERTVQRWKAGVTKPKPQDIEAIRRLLDIQREAPRPEWAEGLADDIAGKVIAELTTSRADEMRRLIDDLEQRLAQRSEAPPVRTDTADLDG